MSSTRNSQVDIKAELRGSFILNHYEQFLVEGEEIPKEKETPPQMKPGSIEEQTKILEMLTFKSQGNGPNIRAAPGTQRKMTSMESYDFSQETSPKQDLRGTQVRETAKSINFFDGLIEELSEEEDISESKAPSPTVDAFLKDLGHTASINVGDDAAAKIFYPDPEQQAQGAHKDDKAEIDTKKKMFRMPQHSVEEQGVKASKKWVDAPPKALSFLIDEDDKDEKNHSDNKPQNSHLKFNEDTTNVPSTSKGASAHSREDPSEESASVHLGGKLPEGYTEDDDLNNDGKIDILEKQIKISFLKDNIRLRVEEGVRNEYYARFRQEVDFHHKIAFRFERAYRLVARDRNKYAQMNEEILSLIQEHSDFIHHDPMSLFYLVFFCIQYKNEEIFTFLRVLFYKYVGGMRDMKAKNQINDIIDQCETYGLETLRTIGEKSNQRLYHRVLFNAFDDKLRIVYSKIIRKLRFLMLRNADGKLLLETRDYEMIKICLGKFTFKIERMPNLTIETEPISNSYRAYSAAYFEEIILHWNIDDRIAKNFRERFIIDSESIYEVVIMYSKKDYIEHFLKSDLSTITHAQVIELFLICIKNDSLKVALQLFLRYMTNVDVTPKVLDSLINSILYSVKLHELKLFFLHELFDYLNIVQLNTLVDGLIRILKREDLRMHPMLSQVNSVKVSLLLYRICFKIEQQRIYSLITKCMVINHFVFKSLNQFLHAQSNISQLYKFMLEPKLSTFKDQDMLDLLIEMKLENILNHPMVIDVLNLVYESKFSIDSKVLYLSSTFTSFVEMEVADEKSITESLWGNIKGSERRTYQSSLQFNIWKYCLEQRFNDELLFTCLLCAILNYYAFQINQYQVHSINDMRHEFTDFIGLYNYLWMQAPKELVAAKCKQYAGADFDLLDLSLYIESICRVVLIIALGTGSSIIQKLAISRINLNSKLKKFDMLVDLVIFYTAIKFIIKYYLSEENNLITDFCEEKGYAHFQPEIASRIGKGLFFITDFGHGTGFQFATTMAILAFNLKTLKLLERTQTFGHIIIVMSKVVEDFQNFMITFGAVFLGFFILLRLLSRHTLHKYEETFVTVKTVFEGLSSSISLGKYSSMEASALPIIFQMIVGLFLLGFLTTMFILRYSLVYKNIEAIKRLDVIHLKNSQGYDPVYGAITMSFFPLNIFLIPFYLPLLLLQSEKANGFVTKLQYAFLAMAYAVIGFFLSILIVPLLYIKMVANSLYIVQTAKRSKYIGEHYIHVVVTLIFGPFFILVSLLIDLCKLPDTLMKDEHKLELKYQASQKLPGFSQVFFVNIFFKNFLLKTDFRVQRSISEIELMNSHIHALKIVDNFHSFFCRGDKSYRDASMNIYYFIKTKELGKVSSIPSEHGDNKTNQIDFVILRNLLSDIIMYNYYYMVVKDYRRGFITDRAKIVLFSEPEKDYDQKKHEIMQGYTLHRDITDLFNLFNVQMVARAFTNIETRIQAYQEENSFFQQRKLMVQIQQKGRQWKRDVSFKFSKMIMSLDDRVLGVEKKLQAKKKLLAIQGSARGLSNMVATMKGRQPPPSPRAPSEVQRSSTKSRYTIVDM